ncbi:DUF294 nucleotidyltransferase-like domain-containing protein [Pseudalkalibacillus caeni]|uniref:Cyclic nucleotide-binding domain-containing protein n=1 Tax=Exobacillus caeni TaxID=2574798 RepID=A0A5R9EVY4_9BACL|nr:DUF294 nucleotidyltransferase-like domain-containing protein [Pseudalkalibacillus caeni]TLS35207.1 cyclic nucleotide-binding domain-containing protein [Pseudalkalibacillus caeni]
MQDFYNLIDKKEPFHYLTSDQKKRLLADAELQEYNKGEFLFHEKDEEVDLFLVVSGIAKNIVHKANGHQTTMRFYYPGDLIGLMIMLTSGTMTFSVQAIENCKVIKLRKEVVLNAMNENPRFSSVMLESIGDRMRTLYDEIKLDRQREEDSENIVLFRTRINSIMEEDIKVPPAYTVMETAELFKQDKPAGVIVSEDEESILGVVTTHSILKAVTEGSLSDPIHRWMEQEPFTVEADAFSYEALAHIKYHPDSLIPVIHRKLLVGMVSAQSFLRLQDSAYLDLLHRIKGARDYEEVEKLSPLYNNEFHTFVSDMLVQDTLAYDICEMISNYNDEIHKQIIILAEEEMKQEGHGLPPVNYCFIVMGSEGRKEQAFSTDQDNGFILDEYEHLPYRNDIQAYFRKFAEKINTKLVECGFPECEGGIMAKEEKWCRSISSWKKEVNRWIQETDAEEIRNFTIFLDFRPIYGDLDLAISLRREMTKRVQKAQSLHMLLMKDTIRFRVPLNPLGQLHLKGKSKKLNLKKSAIMQIVNGVRIFAMKYGIEETNTLKRLYRLKEKEIFHPRDVKNIETALHYLYWFRINGNLKQIAATDPINNELSPVQLSREDRKKLKEALVVAKRMQQVSELSFRKNRSL